MVDNMPQFGPTRWISSLVLPGARDLDSLGEPGLVNVPSIGLGIFLRPPTRERRLLIAVVDGRARKMSRRIAIATVLTIAFSAVLVTPAAAAKPPKSDGEFCYDVSFTSEIPVPPPGQVSMQRLVLGDDCRIRAEPIVTMDGSDMPTATADSSSAVGSEGQTATDVTTAALYNYRAYAVTRIWDCCGILLTEYWMENNWTSTGSTGYIYGWGAVDGAKWHREGPFGCCGGWYLDNGSHLLGLTAGGLYKTYETVRGRQGFGYQGALDPTGTYFYNRLTHWITGYRNGSWGCTQEVYLKKVPLPPLDWDIQRWCGSGYYPYK